MRFVFAIVIFLTNTSLLAQTTIFGRVLDSDSNAVTFATVRLGGLDVTQSDENGYFEFAIPKRIQESHYLKGGIDLPIDVEKDGWAVLDPPDRKIRLLEGGRVQEYFEIIVAPKGSPVFSRSERMLEHLMTERIKENVKSKDQEFAGRAVLTDEATRLGLDKDELSAAIENYKDSFRTSTDLYKRGLAALYDAQFAEGYIPRKNNLDTAMANFREALRKDELAVHEDETAKERLPGIYRDYSVALFLASDYDSALFYLSRADSATSADADILNWRGMSLYKLAKYDSALALFRKVATVQSALFGFAHPSVALELNNMAVVYNEKRVYDSALYSYREAFTIDTAYFGYQHPDVANDLNNMAGTYKKKGEYDSALHFYREAFTIDSACFGYTHFHVARELNNIGLLYNSHGTYDSALYFYREAFTIDSAYFTYAHPNVALILNNMAGAYYEIGEYETALKLLKDAYDIFLDRLGAEHPYTADAYLGIAIIQSAIDEQRESDSLRSPSEMKK